MGNPKKLANIEGRRVLESKLYRELEMLGSIVSRLGSVNPQHVCSLCKFIFTYLQS